MTEADIIAHNLRVRAGRGKGAGASKSAPQSQQVPEKAIRRGVQNKLEARFERDVLIPRKAAGEIADYKFEAIKVRLASGAYYCPDFAVWFKDGSVEFVEVKGFMREAAHIRLKVAAELYPHFRFYLCKLDKVFGWQITEY